MVKQNQKENVPDMLHTGNRNVENSKILFTSHFCVFLDFFEQNNQKQKGFIFYF